MMQEAAVSMQRHHQLQEGGLVEVLCSFSNAPAEPNWHAFLDWLLWDIIAGKRASHGHGGLTHQGVSPCLHRRNRSLQHLLGQ
jgi:hypothetical protein